MGGKVVANTRRGGWRRRFWLIAAVIVLGVALALLWRAVAARDRRSTGERLAEIEAARAIPDAENAAFLYDRLLQDPNARSLLDNAPDSLIEEVQRRALYQPWLSEDHPELTAWVEGHQYLIDGLLDAAQLEHCRFPISIDVANMALMALNRVPPMRKWAFLLSAAANNDVGEGRVDSAIAKWRCLIQVRNHLCQQPDLVDHLLARHVQELALTPMARWIVAGDLAEAHLREIEAMPLPLEDCWAEYEREIRVIDALMMERLTEGLGPLDYLKYRLMSHRMNRIMQSTMGNESPLEKAGPMYRRHLAVARGTRILVALRRYRNANDRWPARLDEIRSSLPTEAWVDPVNQGSFAYRLSADSFKLHSVGENGLDEDGAWSLNTGDDWPIWPPRERFQRTPGDSPFGQRE